MNQVCKVLIANKCDVEDRQVERSEGEELANNYGISFFETSAKSNVNVAETFQAIAKEIKDKILVSENNPGPGGNKLLDGETNKNKKKDCC